MPQVVDLDALAKKHGGSVSIDDIAAKYGGKVSGASKPATAPAKGIDDPTVTMSAPQLGDNLTAESILGMVEGFGIDPAHPAKSSVEGLKKMLTSSLPEQKEQAKALLSSVGDYFKNGLTALGSLGPQVVELASPGSQTESVIADPRKAANAAGKMLPEAGVVEGASQGVQAIGKAGFEAAKAALPSAARSGAKLQKIQGVVEGTPIDTTKVQSVVDRAKELKATGSTMPKVMSDTARLLDKPLATTLKNEPYVPYEQGRDLQSSAGRLSVSEKLSTNPQMQAQVGKLAQALKEANRDVAASAGLGKEFDAAMKEYRRAMQIKDTAAGAAELAKKYGLKAVVGGGLVYALAKEHLLP